MQGIPLVSLAAPALETVVLILNHFKYKKRIATLYCTPSYLATPIHKIPYMAQCEYIEAECTLGFRERGRVRGHCRKKDVAFHRVSNKPVKSPALLCSV